MAEMKDSGIEWIGMIPKNWNADKIKYHLKRNEPKNPGNVEVLSVYREYGVIPKNSRDDNHNITSEDTSKYKYVKKGDLVINKMKAWQGSMGVSEYEGIVSPAYFIYNFTDNYLDKKYFHFLIRNCYKDEFRRISGGIREGQWDLSADLFADELVLVPPIKEQIKIVEFLNTKCAEIDTLYSDIEKQIDILEEYKKSIITEAVTKGLDPDVEMKDSGIEWIGKIPKNWKTNKIKYLFTSGKGLSITKENLIDEGLPVISYGQIHAKTNSGVDINKDLLQFVSYEYQKRNPNCEVKKFDFIFADTSEDYEGCGNGVYKRDNSILFAGYHSIILRAINQKDNRYLAYLFLTDLWRKQIRETASGVKVFSVTQKNLINSSIILPPEDEQNEIANYLDVKCNKIDSIIVDKKKQLETLEQYKKSLIYEYVTGKKEVLND